MAGAGQNDRGSSGAEAAPPFWLRTEKDGLKIVDDRVLAVAKENWQWAFCLVRRTLHDGPSTAQVVEPVAIEVTNRLKADPEVDRNLRGYFRTAIMQRIKTLAVRNSRMAYEGRPQDLETNHHPTAPDWSNTCEDRMTIESLLPYMPHPVRRILHFRLLDYSWKETAEELNVPEKTAKNRFYRGLGQAYEKLIADQAQRWRKEARQNERPR